MLPVIQILLINGADMLATDNSDRNPFDVAYANNFPLVVRLFVHHGYPLAHVPSSYVLQSVDYGWVGMACVLLGLGVVPEQAEVEICFALAHRSRLYKVMTMLLGYFPLLLQYLIMEHHGLQEGEHEQFYGKIVRRLLCLEEGQTPSLSQFCAVSILGSLARANYERLVQGQGESDLLDQPQLVRKYVRDLWTQIQLVADHAWPPLMQGDNYQDFLRIYNLDG